jgi:putative membrane protein
MLMRLVWHWLILALGLYLITLVKPLGITFSSTEDLAWAALILILVNTFIKPVLILISLPLVLLTLGLFLLIINAIILYTLPDFVPGFHVPGFGSAFFGSLLLSLITGFFSGYEKRLSVRRIDVTPSRPASGGGKVIDI